MSVDLEILKKEIVACLTPLELDKIILFGSYARGTANEDSDIDLFLMKDINRSDVRNLKVDARLRLLNLTKQYKLAFDILVAPESYLNERQDYFSRIDILQDGTVLYAKS